MSQGDRLAPVSWNRPTSAVQKQTEGMTRPARPPAGRGTVPGKAARKPRRAARARGPAGTATELSPVDPKGHERWSRRVTEAGGGQSRGVSAVGASGPQG